MALLTGAIPVPGVVCIPPTRHLSRPAEQVSNRFILGLGQSLVSRSPHSVGYRRTIVRAAGVGQGTEKQFKTTVELDKLIDTLRETADDKLPQVVAENVLGFNTDFWLRLAARADLATSPDDQKDYEVLASNIMTLVELIVRKTQIRDKLLTGTLSCMLSIQANALNGCPEKIESSTDILKSILVPLIESDDGEISWPPRNPESLSEMRKEVQRRDGGGYLDESFLSEVSAQLRQAKEDKDKPGLVAILQNVLQLYASTVLSKRSYAVKGDKVDKAEELLEKLVAADEEDWNELLRTGLVFGGGSVEPKDLYKVADKRVERTLMRTENGSYQQRLLVEYLREIQTRAELLAEAFQSPRP